MQQNKRHLFLPYFYRKLCSFNVDKTFRKMFYCCFIESALTFTLVRWYDLLNPKNKNRLWSIVRMCCKIAGITVTELSQRYKLRILQKAESVLADHGRPLVRGG